MNNVKRIFKIAVASLVMFLQLKFIEFFYVDSCLDRGGRFLGREMMCESDNGFISFSLAPIFYVITCIIFGVVIFGVLALCEHLMSKLLRRS